MDTSAAVSLRVHDFDKELEKDIAAFDDDTRAHVARATVSWWLRISRVGALAFFIPVAGCAVLAPTVPDAREAIVAIAWLLVLAGLPVQLILQGIARRAIADEVRLLGYDRATQKLALSSWQRAMKAFMPLIGRVAKERAVKQAMDELVQLAQKKRGAPRG